MPRDCAGGAQGSHVLSALTEDGLTLDRGDGPLLCGRARPFYDGTHLCGLSNPFEIKYRVKIHEFEKNNASTTRGRVRRRNIKRFGE